MSTLLTLETNQPEAGRASHWQNLAHIVSLVVRDYVNVKVAY